MSRSNKRKRQALGPVQGPPRPPKDPLPGRGQRKNGEPYHVEEYAPRWFEPKLSEKPEIDHQIQSIRIAFEHMEDAYRLKTKTGELGPGDAEFRLRGMLDALRTLHWLKDNMPAIKRRTEATS